MLRCKFWSATHDQPDYLHNLISVPTTCRTRSSSVVTLARPSVSSRGRKTLHTVSSSLQITDRSFRYVSSHPWIPSTSLVHCPPGSVTTFALTSYHSLSLFTPSLRHICSTNRFLQSSGSLWTAFTEFWFGMDLLCISFFVSSVLT